MNIALFMSILWLICSLVAGYKAKTESDEDGRVISYIMTVVFTCFSQFFLGISFLL